MIRPLILTGLLLCTAQAQLVASFKAGDATDTRLDRLPALFVKAGEPATPFLAPGAFEVTWTGQLTISERQRLVFSFEGNGNAALTIDGKPVLEESGELGTKPSERLRLNPGDHEISLTFKSQPDGSGRIRLFWEEASFPKQSIPPVAFKSTVSEASTLGELQRQGRALFAENHCAKCHTAATGFGSAPMPELSELVPLLAGIGDRVNEGWLKHWIASPQSLRPTTRMPALVDATTEAGRQQAADLAAYVITQTFGAPAGSSPDPALAQKGGETFHTLGCVACHSLPSQSAPDQEHKRLPLNNVAAKFKPGALVPFLKKPDAYHPFTGMPDFRLSDEEANSLAAYLTAASSGKETQPTAPFPAGDKTRGEALAKSLNCGTCHSGLPVSETPPPALDTIFKKDWSTSGCVAPADKRGKAPVLHLNDSERSALVAFSKTGSSPLTRDTPGEYVRRQIESQRCTNCHSHDGKGSLLDSVHTDSRSLVADLKHLDERVDQSRPQLTYLGEMLHATVTESMIQGTTNPRPRPWLLMRMPAFHAKAKSIADGFSRMHGIEPSGPKPFTVDPALAETGKTLANATGFGCTTCHAIGDQKPTAAFEVQGVDLQLSAQRLREDYYFRWMANPGSITPSTKMPKYSEGNVSQRTDLLEGDAHKQFEAIWHFLHQK
jgi:mono/diheme cytochrome c family protein